MRGIGPLYGVSLVGWQVESHNLETHRTSSLVVSLAELLQYFKRIFV